MVPHGWDLGKLYRTCGVRCQGLFHVTSNLCKWSIRQSIKSPQSSQDVTWTWIPRSVNEDTWFSIVSWLQPSLASSRNRKAFPAHHCCLDLASFYLLQKHSTQKFWPTPPAVLSLADKPLRMQLTELPCMHSSLLTPGRPELTARLLWSCPPVTSQGAAQFHFTGCPRGPGASGCPVHKPPSLSPLSHGPFQAPWSPIFLPTPMHSHWEPLLQQQSRLWVSQCSQSGSPELIFGHAPPTGILKALWPTHPEGSQEPPSPTHHPPQPASWVVIATRSRGPPLSLPISLFLFSWSSNSFASICKNLSLISTFFIPLPLSSTVLFSSSNPFSLSGAPCWHLSIIYHVLGALLSALHERSHAILWRFFILV